ncbi:MAG: methyltransferase family protein [bacterium]
MVPLKIVAATAVFAFFHSLAASEWCKDKVRGLWSRKFLKVYYRMVYNVFSLVLVALLGIYIYILPNTPWWNLKQLDLLLSFFRWLGILLAVIALKETNPGYFLGISQITDYLNAKTYKPELMSHGIYRFCRHPMYLGVAIFLWSRSYMSRNLFMLSAAVSVYFYIGSLLEEKKLEHEFGENYLTYRNSVPRFIPCFLCHKKDS